MWTGFTDIQKKGWVEKVPEKWRPYIYLARIDRPIGVWLLLLPGLWSIVLAGGISHWPLMALFAFGAVVMRGAGCVINDIWDRDLDRQVERTALRPLAAGEVSVKGAAWFLLCLLLCGFVVLLQMNSMTIILGLVSLPLIIAYPLMKRITYWPQAFLGLVFNFGALMGWSAVTGGVDAPALYLYLGGFFWTIGYDTVYAHQDKEDDALVGVKSTALKFGDKSREWVLGFYGCGFVCLVWAVLSVGGGFMDLFLLSIPLGYGFGSIKRWDVHSPENSLLVFKSSRNLGLIILVSLAFVGKL